MKENPKTKIDFAWVTFETMDQRNKAFEFFSKTPIGMCCTKMCMCCLEKRKHMIDKNMITIDDAPEPDNIRWENLGLSGTNLWIRKSISVVIAVFCLVIATILTTQLTV